MFGIFWHNKFICLNHPIKPILIQQIMNSNQGQIIQRLIDTTQGQLDQIAQSFLSHFKDATSVFEAASILSQQIIDKNLNYLQRFIAIYLLLISYENPVSSHPFIWTLLEVSATTDEPLERQMIADLLIRNNKQDYRDWLLQNFHVEVEKHPDLNDQEEQMKKLRMETQAQFKEFQSFVDIRKQTTTEDTGIQFLRPFPQFLKISESELHWLSPGIIGDVEWDNTADIDRKLEKSRKIFNTALDKQLEAGERQQLLNSIELDPHSPLHIGLKPQFLGPLVINNPYIAAALIIKVAKYSVMKQYLEEFLKIPTNVLLFDAMARIVKQIRIPQTYMIVFCTHHMENVIKAPGEIEQKKPLICTTAAFMQCMFENYIIGPMEVKSELKKFMDEFSEIVDFGYFKHQLDKLTN